MATKTIIFRGDPGATYTLSVESIDAATVIQSGIACTELSAAGSFSAAVTAAVAGVLTPYVCKVYIGGSQVGYFFVDLVEAAGTYEEQNSPTIAMIGAGITVGGGGDQPIVVSITVPPAVAAASQDPQVITCVRGDTLRRTLPPMGSLAGRTKLVFTAKYSVNDTDDQAVVQITEAAGLVVCNVGGSLVAGNGSLTVTDADAGLVNLVIAANVTKYFSIKDLVWDCQVTTSTGTTTPIGNPGTFSVVGDVTRTP